MASTMSKFMRVVTIEEFEIPEDMNEEAFKGEYFHQLRHQHEEDFHQTLNQLITEWEFAEITIEEEGEQYVEIRVQ